MNRRVPDFEIDEDFPILTSSGLTRPKKSALAEEDNIMELLWQNGQVVVQTQNQRSLKKSYIGEAVIHGELSSAREIRSEEETTPQLFMQEDEMASWLHYPLDDSSFERDTYSDLLCSAPCATVAAPVSEVRSTEVRQQPQSAVGSVTPLPSMPSSRLLEIESPVQRHQNFACYSRPKGRTESGPSSSTKARRELTIVESNETPAVGLESRVTNVADRMAQVYGGNKGFRTMSASAAAGTSSAARELATCELSVTSSPGGSGASLSASAEPSEKPTTTTVTEDRKRKGREPDNTECHSEDVEFESGDVKKQVRGSTSTKRSRAAEVHNLSERRRRDRINEKMKALQELIPRCNKSDKASMLDEAIEYLKSLQMQVQMMSMGCSMVPVMFPGMHQYMPPMGMGMGLGWGMGMGMEMGMNRPMVPFPSVLPSSALQTPAAAAHFGPRFPMPAFHVPQARPVADPSRIQATNHPEPVIHSLVSQNPNQPRIPNFAVDPYQQYFGVHQAQVPLPQNQAVVQPSTGKTIRSREIGNTDNHQSG